MKNPIGLMSFCPMTRKQWELWSQHIWARKILPTKEDLILPSWPTRSKTGTTWYICIYIYITFTICLYRFTWIWYIFGITVLKKTCNHFFTIFHPLTTPICINLQFYEGAWSANRVSSWIPPLTVWELRFTKNPGWRDWVAGCARMIQWFQLSFWCQQ